MRREPSSPSGPRRAPARTVTGDRVGDEEEQEQPSDEGELPFANSSSRVARGRVVAMLTGAFPQVVIEVAELLTSELVTNAVMHGSPTIRLHVEADGERLRVEVHDGNREEPASAVPAPEVGGRGLAIVDALATRWGTVLDDDGKYVWFELTT